MAMAKPAGYSGTPLPKKLGIKDGAHLALLNAPDGFSRTLGDLPPDVRVAAAVRAGADFDVIVWFVTRQADIDKRFRTVAGALATAGGLWIAWPKRSSGVSTDVTENTVRATALAAGLVDNKVCAIDEIWSGLRCVIRVADRPKPAARKPRPA